MVQDFSFKELYQFTKSNIDVSVNELQSIKKK